MTRSKERLAIIGGGAAGITAAYLLQHRFDVTLYEKEPRLGGHANTIIAQDRTSSSFPIDTGFIVCNDRTYVSFQKLLKRLGVPVRPCDMSFSFQCDESGLRYGSSGFNTLFADRRNLFRRSYYHLLSEITRFWKAALSDLKTGAIRDVTIAQYLKRNKFSHLLFENYVVPLASSLWLNSADSIAAFPAEILVRFFGNNGVLSWNNHPNWQTVVGGSHSYVKAFREKFYGRISLDSKIHHVRRSKNSVFVSEEQLGDLEFSHVIFATHADQALALLLDPSSLEKKVLGAWRYNKNRVVLHCDETFLPEERLLWSSWNCRREKGEKSDQPTSLSYLVNKLQGIQSRRQYILTVNPRRTPNEVLYETEYEHPVFSMDALQSQRRFPEIHGRNRSWFCGSYRGYGFHEDAVRSAADVAYLFGVEL